VPGAPALVQLLVGCLTAGMMRAGGFFLATVPLAGMAYVVIIDAGAFFALLQNAAPVYLGLSALLVVYTAVVIVNLNWIAFLFISHFLAEAQVQREVAARERAQAQAAHAQRMIALGELAGGIAHDFNNVLQVISGRAEMIERCSETPAEVLRLARRLRQAAERGGSISRRLLALARRDILEIAPVNIVGALKGLCDQQGGEGTGSDSRSPRALPNNPRAPSRSAASPAAARLSACGCRRRKRSSPRRLTRQAKRGNPPPTPAQNPLVLVVDDDEFVREVIIMSLEGEWFAAQGAADAAAALACIDRGRAVDAVLSDFYMPGMSGLDLIGEVQKRHSTLPAILLTGHVGDIAAAPVARTVGSPLIVLQKPVPATELVKRLTVAIASQRS
jgi:CheY-like chemotaxis protein